MNNRWIQKANEYDFIIFYDENSTLVNIDYVFHKTNTYFVELLQEMGLPPIFNFSNRDYKKIYTHAFLYTMCEYIKNDVGPYKIFFYSDQLTKDRFRNSLIKKIKTIFGFQIMEGLSSFKDVVEKIRHDDAELIPELEIMFSSQTKPKTFKHIKKYLEKTGLRGLNDEYFQNISHRMMLMK